MGVQTDFKNVFKPFTQGVDAVSVSVDVKQGP
jgi:hypothetical protein